MRWRYYLCKNYTLNEYLLLQDRMSSEVFKVDGYFDFIIINAYENAIFHKYIDYAHIFHKIKLFEAIK